MQVLSDADKSLARRLNWLNFFRIVISLVSMLSILVIEGKLRAIPETYKASYYVLVLAVGISIAYSILGEFLKAKTLAMIQIAVDLLMESLLVYLTGIIRVFVYLYFLTVIVTALLVGKRTAYVSASLSTIALAGISLTYFFANREQVGFPLPFVEPSVQQSYVENLNFILPYTVFFSLSLHVVAFLSVMLSEELQNVRILNVEILQNMADGVVTVDKLGKIAFINQNARDILGFDNDEIKGKDFKKTLPRELSELINSTLTTTYKIDNEMQVGNKLIRFVSTPMTGERDDVKGVVAILSDISHRQEMNRIQKESDRFKMLHELSAGVAHEIRNPLASIRGAAQELGRDKKERGAIGSGATLVLADKQKLLQIIIKESDRLNDIIKDFLDFASTKPYEMVQYNLVEVIKETAHLIEMADKDKKANITIYTPKSIFIKCAPDKLKQLFLNIGLNSLEAIKNKGVIAIRCSTTDEGGLIFSKGAKIEIEDDGSGIAEENVPHLFTPFFTTKPRGTGMGLAIANKIVQAHGGNMKIENNQGKGTKCTIWLPA